MKKRLLVICICGAMLSACGSQGTVKDSKIEASDTTSSNTATSNTTASNTVASDTTATSYTATSNTKSSNTAADGTADSTTTKSATGKAAGSAASDSTIEGAKVISLSNDSAAVDGEAVKEYDYTWCIDPSKEKPWYEGTEPSGEEDVYIAHDIVYYPKLDVDGFSLEEYDGEQEWVYRYKAEGLEDYLFSTLPSFMGTSEVPEEMMHSAEEAYENKVLHITKAGTYVLEGEWHGQIYIDLGDKDETFTDENAKVTIYMNGVDVTCDVNAAFLACSAYECDNGWEDRSDYSGEVDTSDAGVNVVICDGTKNNFTGANVYRLLKGEYKKEGSTKQKKLYKVDGAFYSCVSMNITGEENDAGLLNITSTSFEGLDTELHLTINGGNITIYSQDDGINVNEDDVSVFTMNGGTLHIFAGLGREGDCVDSNGYATVNGGTIAAGTPSAMDEVLDTNNGSTVNGGTVISVGSSEMNMGSFNPGDGFGGNRPDGNGFGGDGNAPQGDFDPSNMPKPGGTNGTMPENFNPGNMAPPSDNNSKNNTNQQ